MNWLKSALIGALFAFGLASQALSQTAMTRSQLEAGINSTITSNGIGAITGPILNTQLNDLAASMATTSDPNTFAQAQTFSSGATGISTSPPSFALYVCPTGSDSNPGTSSLLAFATLAKARAAVAASPALNTVGLCAGGSWVDSLVTVNSSNSPWASIGAYGVGTPPHIDGAVVTTGWTQVGSANAWTVSLAHEVSSQSPPANPMTVYQNGLPMTRTANISACEASGTPAFVDIYATATSPATVTVCPGTGDNPNSDSNLYETTTFNLGAFTSLPGASVVGVYASRYANPNGPIFSQGQPSAIQQSVSSYGLKHNYLIGSGSMTDSIAYLANPVGLDGGDSNENAIVAFGNSFIGQNVTLTRVGLDIQSSIFNTLFFNHALDNSPLATFSATQVWTLGSIGLDPFATTVTAQGFYSTTGNPSLALGTNSGSVTFAQVNTGASGFSSWQQLSPISLTGTENYTFTDDVWFTSQFFNNPFWNGSGTIGSANVTFQNDIIEGNSFATCLPGWTSGTFTVNNTINVSTRTNSGGIMCVPTGVSYVGNNNIFVADPAALGFIFHGTTINTLAAWRTATGQDANSIVCVAGDLPSLFVNDAGGNFTIGPSPTCAGVLATGAGINQHWDWNARQVVPGPPVKWPTVPASLADQINYVANPAAWKF